MREHTYKKPPRDQTSHSPIPVAFQDSSDCICELAEAGGDRLS